MAQEDIARFDFFSLPPELRNSIYEDVIKHPGCIQSARIRHDILKPACGPPPITQVCRKLRHETLELPVFLGRSIEVYVDIDTEDVSSSTHQMEAWLGMIGPEYAGLIKNLTVYMPLPLNQCSWKAEHDCEGCDCWGPNSSEDVCAHLGLEQLGIKPSAVRGLFGAHLVEDYYSDHPRKGSLWEEARASLRLEQLWWTPVAGEQHRNGDNGVWQDDEPDEGDEQKVDD